MKGFLEELYGPNLGYLIDQFEKYKKDHLAVEPEIRVLLKEMNEADFADSNPPITTGSEQKTVQDDKLYAVLKLADHIRNDGHLAASIYPLGHPKPNLSHLELCSYNLTEADLERLPAKTILGKDSMSLKTALEAYQYLKSVYTKTIAYEFQHIHDEKERNWLIDRIEDSRVQPILSNEKRLTILKRLTEVEEFEKFLHKKFVGQKRFSIEGLDAMVPLLDEIISGAVINGAEFINIGMAHRGRLNVLAHVIGKPYEMIFAEFQHAPNKELVPSEGSIGINYGWTGDVKYHLGLNRNFTSESFNKAKITLANNPSHLEYVGSVVEGFTRASQVDVSRPGYPKENEKSSLAILIHGDAAFPGEGIVAEILNLSQLKGYRTGGTIHIIANNMIGFTTESSESRSTRYASDLAKGFEIPIIHVNADDPEACIAAAMLAVEYRSVFHKDFLIDLVGYRRFGHNEMDEPMTTNPQMYALIQKHATVKEIYENTLKSKRIVSEETLTELQNKISQRLETAHRKVLAIKKAEEWKDPEPPPFKKDEASIITSVPLSLLRKINNELLQWPNDFKVFHKLEKILKRRAQSLEDHGKVDWALAENLAFATILADGTPIRISGQDTERGTFAQRNLVLHDQETGKAFVPLHHFSNVKASFDIYNSPLTEAAVVGFEYGYSVFSPGTLVIWEAQYGDFANAAQVMFDQFLAAGRAKWGQKSGLVLLLPHGYEGQGPEHSSARLERFLQLGAEKNWTVANPTTAAQYFHLLRRQAAMLNREEIRPLVIMSPKSLLRNPLVSSPGTELSEGKFRPVMEQFTFPRMNENVKRVVLCTGKIAVDLAEQIKESSHYDWLQIIRLEEIYPFPEDELKAIFTKYPNIKEVYWVQEEPKNMGAWTFVESRINELVPNRIRVNYIGRRRRSSPAEGEPNVHKLIQSQIFEAALTWDDGGGSNHG